MGGAPALLDQRRAAWGAALLAVLIVYFEVYTPLWRASIWWDVAWIAVVLMSWEAWPSRTASTATSPSAAAIA